MSRTVVDLAATLCPSHDASSSPSSSSSSSVKSSPPPLLLPLFLLGCKWSLCCSSSDDASPSSSLVLPAGLTGSYRRMQGLCILQSIVLEKKGAQGWFYSDQERLFLLRATLFPALLNCLVNGFRAAELACFQKALSLVEFLYESSLVYLSTELRILLQHALLPLLEASFATLRQKQLVLELLRRCVLRTPARLAALYTNADLKEAEAHVIDRLFLALQHLLEGEVEALPEEQETQTPSDGGKEDEEEEEPEVTKATLAQHSLRLLVHLLSMQAQWVGVPGLKRVGEVPTPLLQSAGRNEQQRQATDASWHALLSSHRRTQQLASQVFQLARSGKVKAALRYQSQMMLGGSSPEEMARYLLSTPSLDASDVGDFLAALDDDFLDKTGHDRLRNAFVKQIGFAGLSFDAALRVFLCDCGFRLPGEAQKIDRSGCRARAS